MLESIKNNGIKELKQKILKTSNISKRRIKAAFKTLNKIYKQDEDLFEDTMLHGAHSLYSEILRAENKAEVIDGKTAFMLRDID